MSGLSAHLRPSAVASTAPRRLASRLVLFLAAIPLLVAFFALVLQWRGDFDDPASRWPTLSQTFPGTESGPLGSSASSSTSGRVLSSSSDCAKIHARRSSPSLLYYRGWKFGFDSDSHPKISIVSTTSASLEQILPWLFYHKVLGVTQFLLFVEGKAATSHSLVVLESIPGVKVIPRIKDLEEKQAQSRVWNETWLAEFFYKPCNHELFVKQSLNMEMAIVMAREAGMDWILHLDTDELMHPAGTQGYSLKQLLQGVPSDVDMVVFPNYESCPERDDVKDPFNEVSMFKKNFDHLPSDAYFAVYDEATRGNPNYFLTYANGKSAARIQDHLRSNGAHAWYNYEKDPKEVKLDEAAVLHYTYSKFSDLTSRRERCRCKPTKDDVKRCFMLDFDRDAFIIASTATEEEMLRWYNEHVVWTDEKLKTKLLKMGVLTRIHQPMVIIQGLRESGVFSSAIASAQAFSKEKFVSSMEGIQNKNSLAFPSLTTAASKNTMRRAGGRKSQAAARKILETTVFPGNAIPPKSLPGLDDIQIKT